MTPGLRGRPARLLVLWLGLLAAGVLAGLAVEGNGLDGALVRSVAGERTGGLTAAARLVSQFGGIWRDVVLACLLGGLLLAGRRRDAVLVLLAAGGAMLLTDAIKVVLERPRPAGGGLVRVQSSSWPSGHASGAVALYGALAVIAAHAKPRPARIAIWVGLGALTATIGASRVYLGVHYPTDVAAGWALGGLWLLGVLAILGPAGSGRPGAGPPA